jgi:peroxiredoxin
MTAFVGKPALTFELPDTKDRIHRLDDYAGRWLLLVFHRHLM